MCGFTVALAESAAGDGRSRFDKDPGVVRLWLLRVAQFNFQINGDTSVRTHLSCHDTVHVHTRPVRTINDDVTNTSTFNGTIASILPVEIERLAFVNTGRGGGKTRDLDHAVKRERILRRVGGKGDVAVRVPGSPSSCSCETVIFTKWGYRVSASALQPSIGPGVGGMLEGLCIQRRVGAVRASRQIGSGDGDRFVRVI